MPAVAKWATAAFCAPYSVDAALDPKTKLTVGLSGTVSAVDARRLLEAALRAQSLGLKEDANASVITAIVDEDAVCERAVRGLHQTGEFSRTVTREAWSSNWTPCAVRSARIVPAIQDGKAVGLKLFGIRRDTIFSAAGFQNGDTLQAVNDLALTSPDAALEATKKLSGEEHLRFTVNRRGETVTLSVDVEPAK